MNHCISFICSSLESVEGWNSESIQRWASGSPAWTWEAAVASANAATDVSNCHLIETRPPFYDLRIHAISEDKRGQFENKNAYLSSNN
jgi:hypothetical protein